MKIRKKIGIIGGSFNPIHQGHLIIAEWFRQELMLDLIIFIPTFISPFKLEDSEVIDPMDRLAMLKLAIESNSKFIYDDFEINKKAVSYTIDTLKYLKSKYLNSDLFYLIGEDQAQKFNKWNKWEDILSIVQLCIARRDFNDEQIKSINEVFKSIKYTPVWISSPKIEISSTEIRNRVKKGKSIKYLTDDKVVDYIISNNVYN